MPHRKFKAIAFDLLTALMDSWAFWISVTGDETLGRAWRRASLRLVTTAGVYRPYEEIVFEAASEVGVPRPQAVQLLKDWAAGKLTPWPETPSILSKLASQGWRTAVVTNCSQRLAEAAASATGHRFDQIVSAERAGFYKIEPKAYKAGLDALGEQDASRVLFVAGSPHDVPGASAVGMDVYWSNRFDDPVPTGSPKPFMNEPNLLAIPGLLADGPATT
jgi:2-haloalkanoic acid dehalogenase type II